ncbi:phosphoribosyl-ATP pyrophosphatase /phosphoribosyl-AMP cyclohydrolase [Peptoclostridium litorale DSM 5388]|uniref:Histidine biosynthesis bifunctional protein HisIE n=1 Tax=Peptoclostridium litorale DSM 5388 TaxID=1121324 RepID=A0A069RLR5_PEPLI|nr:bifunctional phosphoribosyl-AMP cyclohydrolase/phosphoribosyl-ATP diphosphatase HisIE [Peptoclostridium litorale]KDR95107.1 histidine biosynthesis bifunctional protein HisIE [Peptoclostridium litorale DSM 5388]SIN74900.1 phosphoribosyl-ATP pyrophosphatase /phosphoribosyl-AMP cyclohydrolase [Peptoclostridium litorale DSM 5388]
MSSKGSAKDVAYEMDKIIDEIKFDEKGLVPAIVQDCKSGEVLMLAYMNRESFKKTVDTGQTWFYSRSRQELWNKGATSGNVQSVKDMYYDCDADSILVKVEPKGPACHTGENSCFFNQVVKSGEIDEKFENEKDVLKDLYVLIQDRKENPVEGSYTNYLFEKGIDKILKKVGEEAAEVIIGAKNLDRAEITYEVSDLVYHILVLLVETGVSIEDIKSELAKRHKK